MRRLAPFFISVLSLTAACKEDVVEPDFGSLSVTPATPFTSTGPQGGPFAPERASYSVTGDGGPVSFSASTTAEWIDLLGAEGSATEETPAFLTIAIGQGASELPQGSHTAMITIRNAEDTGDTVTLSAVLDVTDGGSGFVMEVTPETGLVASGLEGGPFTGGLAVYTIRSEAGPITFAVESDAAFIDVSPMSGTAGPGAPAQVSVQLNAAANDIPGGSEETGEVRFINRRTGEGNTTRPVTLTVETTIRILVTPNTPYNASGDTGGPFSPATFEYRLSAVGARLDYEVTEFVDWLSVSPASGTIPKGSWAPVTLTLDQAALAALAPGNYNGLVTFTNLTNGIGGETRMVNVSIAVLPDPFDLLTPANNAPAIDLMPTFTWSDSLGAVDYHFDLADSMDFSNVIESTDLQGTSYTLMNELTPSVTYYWRVSATNTTGTTNAQNAPFSFTTGAPPGAFDLSAPANGAVDIDLVPTLSWTASANVGTYDVTVATDAALTNVIESQTGVATESAVLQSALSPMTTYYWQVESVNTLGRLAAANGPFSFTTLNNAGPFSLLIPANGATQVAFPVTLSWQDTNVESSYAVDVATDSGFSNIVFNNAAVAADTTMLGIPSGTLSFGQTYYWRVIADDGASGLPAQNAPFSFTINYWSRSYGAGAGADSVSAGAAGPGGARHLAGSTANNGDPNLDAMWAAVDASGAPLFAFAAGGASRDVVEDMDAASDGGAFLAGTTESAGAGGRDAWLIRITQTGTTAWEQSYGGTAGDEVHGITAFGAGALACGETSSFNPFGGVDALLLGVDGSGNPTLSNSYGGTGDDRCADIRATSDGGSIFIGTSNSFSAGGDDDVWVVKLNAAGNIVWQSYYGGVGNDTGVDIVQTSDGGYILAAQTASFGATTPDLWVVKLASDGSVSGQTRLEGNGNEVPHMLSLDGANVLLGADNGGGLVFFFDEAGALVRQGGVSAERVSVVLSGPFFAGDLAAFFTAGQMHADGSPFLAATALTAQTSNVAQAMSNANQAANTPTVGATGLTVSSLTLSPNNIAP